MEVGNTRRGSPARPNRRTSMSRPRAWLQSLKYSRTATPGVATAVDRPGSLPAKEARGLPGQQVQRYCVAHVGERHRADLLVAQSLQARGGHDLGGHQDLAGPGVIGD